MSLLFYYILRRFFVELEASATEIRLVKGILIKRAAVLPISSIVRITVRRTLVMRLLRAKEISVFTLGGKLVFYLSKNEPLPILPQSREIALKPRFWETTFGAFVDTRALGGIFVFSAALRRVSALFGGEYFDRVVTALTKTANDLENALRFLHITIPKIAVTIGVFALGAWVFAFIRKRLRLARFRVYSETSGSRVIVTSGVFTLYEHALVLNTSARFRSPTSCRRLDCGLRDIRVAARFRSPTSCRRLCCGLRDIRAAARFRSPTSCRRLDCGLRDIRAAARFRSPTSCRRLGCGLRDIRVAAVRVETLASLVTRRAPIYLRGVMICPCVRRDMLPRTLKKLCGFRTPTNRVTSPKRAFFGHILAPLVWLGVFAAALFAAYSLDYSELLKIALYSSVIVKLYTIVLYLLYMRRSGVAVSGEFARITARRGLRLYTAVFPRSACERYSITQSVFQRRSGLCHGKLAIIAAGSFTARQIPKSEYFRRIPF